MDKKFLYWKLQSTNQSDELEIGSKEYEMYRNKYKKDFETGELMSEQETIDHYRKNAYKSPLFSRIFSLTLAFVDNGTIRVQYITGEEKDLLQTFLNQLHHEHFKEYTVCHFGYEYLLPYLGMRLDKHKISTPLPIGLTYRNQKPWQLSGLCIRYYYEGAGNYKPTLKEIAWIFDLEADFIEPADEYTYYITGDHDKLRESAIAEIYTLINVHRCINKEEVIADLTWSEKRVENVQDEVQKNVLELLYEQNAFTPEIKKQLDKLFTKKKLLKKDREVVKEIILAHYLSKSDKAADKKLKEQEIEEWLNKL